MKIVIPAYGRHELTRRVVMYYESMGLQPFVVESPDEDGRVSGVANALCENQPLGAKFNTAVRLAAERYNTDIMICGSDTLLSGWYIEYAQVGIAAGAKMVEAKGCHFFTPGARPEMMFIPSFLCGPGKLMSLELLERCGMEPYDSEKRSNLDSGPKRFLTSPAECRRLAADALRPACIEVRWGQSMTTPEATSEHRNYMSPRLAFDSIGQDADMWRNRG